MYRYLVLYLGAMLLLPLVSVADAGSNELARASSTESSSFETTGSDVLGITAQPYFSLTTWLHGQSSLFSRMDDMYYHALSSATQGNLEQATAEFTKLREALNREVFHNAPEYSFELLRLANQFAEQDKLSEAAWFVDKALLLSPRHPRVLFAVSGMYKVVGHFRALGYATTALSQLTNYPVLLFTILLNAVVVFAIALTLAFLLVSVIQLLRGGEQLVREVGKFFPRAVAGLAGVLLLPLCLVGPLFFGVLAGLAVWSMLLSLYRPSCRYYAFAVAGILLLWAWLIPNARVLGIQTQSSVIHALEDTNAGNFSPRAQKRALAAVRVDGIHSQVGLLTAAMVAQSSGDLDRARMLFGQLSGNLLLPVPVKQMVTLNSAVLQYREGQYKRALASVDALEKDGVSTFELFHNSSLIHMALLETEKYREYFDRARAVDSERLDILQLAAVDGLAPPVAAKLHTEGFWDLLQANAVPTDRDALAAQRLGNALLKGSTPRVLELIAVLTLLTGVFGVVGSMRRTRRRRKSTAFVANFSKNDGSILWCVLPAGYAIAGKYPTIGALYLGVVIASFLVAVGAPMNLFVVAPVETSLAQPFFVVAGVLLFVSCTWSLILYRCSPSLGGIE